MYEIAIWAENESYVHFEKLLFYTEEEAIEIARAHSANLYRNGNLIKYE